MTDNEITGISAEILAGLTVGDIVTLGDSLKEYEVFIAADGVYKFRPASRRAIAKAKAKMLLLDRLNQTLVQRWKRAD